MTSPITSTRGPYTKSSRVRESILDAALELFGTTGYRGATMAAVAERVGMTIPGLKYYFANKDELLRAVLALRDKRDTERAKPSNDMRANLLSVIAQTQENAGFAELHTILSAEATVPEHPAHDYFRARYATIREQISQAASSGAITAALSPDTLAVVILAVLDGVQLQWLLDKNALDMTAIVTEFLDTITPETEPLRNTEGSQSHT